MKTTILYTGDLTEEQKQEIKERIISSRWDACTDLWFEATSSEERDQTTFNLDDYKDDPVYQFYERLLEAINN